MRRLPALFSVYLLIAASAGAVLAPAPAHAQENRHAAAHMGLGMGAFLCTIPYGLVKSVYALGGTLTGGLAWVLTGGRNEIARAIIQPAVRGDYVVVPENLTMEKPLIFSGSDPATFSDSGGY